MMPSWMQFAFPATHEEMALAADRSRSWATLSGRLLELTPRELVHIVAHEVSTKSRPIIIHRAMLRLRHLRVAAENRDLASLMSNPDAFKDYLSARSTRTL
jgi:hypothetical protein